jgi:integrase
MDQPALLPFSDTDREVIVRLVTDSLSSGHSRRAYAKALVDFLDWHASQDRPPLTKALIQHYRLELQNQRLAPSTINVRLSAIRKLAAEAADNGLLDPVRAAGIQAVPGVRSEGRRIGNWLTRDQAQRLLNAPDTSTLKGRRDQALLAVLLGCGLRRQEAADLTLEHIQQREGRWAVVDLIGKRHKYRTVPMASWVKVALDRWTHTAGIVEGRVFRSFRRGDHLVGDSMTSQAIWEIVAQYADQLGFVNLSPHDLRRTYAKLAHKGGAAIEQISLNLGHSSIQVTEDYLGVELDLADAPSDRLGLRLEET